MDQFGSEGQSTTPLTDAGVSNESVGRLVARARELSDVSFRAVLTGDATARSHWCAPDGLEIAGRGATATLVGEGRDRFERVRSEAAELFEALEYDGPSIARPRAFGGVSFHSTHEPNDAWRDFRSARFVVPELQVTRSDDATWATVSAIEPDGGAEAVERSLEEAMEWLTSLPALQPVEAPPSVRKTTPFTRREHWIENVESVLTRIADGDLRKVVLAAALDVTLDGAVDVPAVLERLRRTYPACYRFMIDPGEGATFFGAPPERLVALEDRLVETEALAGSVASGGTPEEESEYATRLRDSGRLQHEHGIVVDTIRRLLGEYASSVDVGEQSIRTLATIQHLRTPIEATLDREEHVLSIVEALHPTPAVGGVPPGPALETIRRTEGFDRGWYAAPVGWFDADGNGEFAVGIRSAIARENQIRLFAGNGIVSDSDPHSEWDEVLLKFRPILDELATDVTEPPER